MSKHIYSSCVKIIIFTVGLLNLSACNNDSDNTSIGPVVKFVLTGTVINKNGDPIQDINTTMAISYKNDKDETVSEPIRSVQTDEKGHFEIQKNNLDFGRKLAIKFEEVEETANAIYQSRVDTIQYLKEDIVSEINKQYLVSKDMGKIVLEKKDKSTDETK